MECWIAGMWDCGIVGLRDCVMRKFGFDLMLRGGDGEGVMVEGLMVEGQGW